MKIKPPSSLLIIILSYFLVGVALIATATSISSILVDTASFYSGLLAIVFAVLLWVGYSKVRTIAIVVSSLFTVFMLVVLIFMMLGKASVDMTIDFDSFAVPIGNATIYVAVMLLLCFMAWQLKALFSSQIRDYFTPTFTETRVETEPVAPDIEKPGTKDQEDTTKPE